MLPSLGTESLRIAVAQLLIGNNGLSRSEAEVQMGMWALWSAPMILSVEVRNGSLTADMKAILLNKEVPRMLHEQTIALREL